MIDIKQKKLQIAQIIKVVFLFKHHDGEPLNKENSKILENWLAISVKHVEIYYRLTTNKEALDLETNREAIKRMEYYSFIRAFHFGEVDEQKKILDNEIMWLMADIIMKDCSPNDVQGYESLKTWASTSPINEMIFDKFINIIYVILHPLRHLPKGTEPIYTTPEVPRVIFKETMKSRLRNALKYFFFGDREDREW